MLVGCDAGEQGGREQVTDLQRDANERIGRGDGAAHLRGPGVRQAGRPPRAGGVPEGPAGEGRLVVWKLDRTGPRPSSPSQLSPESCFRRVGFKVLTGHSATIDPGDPGQEAGVRVLRGVGGVRA